jgi:hypothetical protein
MVLNAPSRSKAACMASWPSQTMPKRLSSGMRAPGPMV